MWQLAFEQEMIKQTIEQQKPVYKNNAFFSSGTPACSLRPGDP
jgi:hypothetical protein